jgi:hypothetical protein
MMSSWEFISPLPGEDMGAVINEAMQTHNVWVQLGNFFQQSRIYVPWTRHLIGSGDGTVLIKQFHGDQILPGPQTVLRNFFFDAAPEWGGGAIIVEEAGYNWQLIQNVNGWAKEYCLKLRDQGAGGRITVENCSWGTRDAAYGVQLPLASEVPGNGIRTFNNIVFNGTWGFDLGGAADTYIRRCNFTNFRYRDNTLGSDVESCRFATGGPIEVRGSNHSLFNNRCQYPFHLMPGLNNSDIWQYRGAGVVDMGAGPNVRVHA